MVVVVCFPAVSLYLLLYIFLCTNPCLYVCARTIVFYYITLTFMFVVYACTHVTWLFVNKTLFPKNLPYSSQPYVLLAFIIYTKFSFFLNIFC